MSEKDIFDGAKKLILKTMNLNDEEISNGAFEYIKENKERLINIFLNRKDTAKKAYFLAGGSGSGKTEFAKTINKELQINIIDTDEIRKLCPYYSGKNSNLFQKASSRGVDILLNEVFKKNYSFILDSNFAKFNLQEQNISRALKRNYQVKIFFIYRPLSIAKEYTKIREEKEGRKVPEHIFYQKFLNSVDTIKQIMAKYNVEIAFYDLHRNISFQKITNFDELINKDETIKKDIILAKKELNSSTMREIKDEMNKADKV